MKKREVSVFAICVGDAQADSFFKQFEFLSTMEKFHVHEQRETKQTEERTGFNLVFHTSIPVKKIRDVLNEASVAMIEVFCPIEATTKPQTIRGKRRHRGKQRAN